MIKKRNKLTPREGQLYVDLYSYDVQKCIAKREELVIEVGNKRMVVPPERLKSYEKLTKEKFVSQFGGKNYYLFSYKWKPQTEEEEIKRWLI